MNEELTSGEAAIAAPPPPVSAVAASLAVNLLTLLLPLVMLQIFDRVIPYQASHTLLLLILGLLAAIMLDFGLKAARATLMSASAEDYERRLHAMATRRALEADPAEFDAEPAPARFERLAAVTQLRDHAGGDGRLLVIDIAFVAVFAGLIWHIGGWLVAVPIVAAALMICVSLAFRKVQFRLFDERRSVDARRFAFLNEFLERMATIKAHRMEAPLLRRYEVLQEGSASASRRLVLLASLSQSFGSVFAQAATAAMALFGAYLVIRGDIGVAELAACTLLNGRAVQPMLKLIGVWSHAEGVAAARRKVAALAALPRREGPAVTPPALRGELEARELTVRRAGADGALFENLSFHVPAGGRLIVTGDDGAGKTTLLRLILSEERPSAGEIRIDGAPAAHQALRRGRGGIVYLDQRPIVFQGSILDNIALTERAEDVDEAMEAARALGLDEEIRRLPQGYETVLGRSGGAASYSFLQRVALARALALKPRILLFNEANTAMDRPSDERALAALAALEGKTTLVVVTRRPGWMALSPNLVRLVSPARRAEEAKEVYRLSWREMTAPGHGAPPPYRLSLSEMVKPGRSAARSQRRPRAGGSATKLQEAG